MEENRCITTGELVRDKTQVYYNESYDWLDSLSEEELIDQALYTLGKKKGGVR